MGISSSFDDGELGKKYEKMEHEAPLSTLFTTHKGEFRVPLMMAPPILFFKTM
jgi:hypothetical protein